ncbi:MAG: hypothetical protein UZ06_CHB003000935 [Chlorobi bacterium OLB6]|nr:MAG: hypothetical protein UZ06_CHB003000935 [Chlorobi bacterium OLB6]
MPSLSCKAILIQLTYFHDIIGHYTSTEVQVSDS